MRRNAVILNQTISSRIFFQNGRLISVQDNFNRLCGLTERARECYNEMITSLEHEMNSSTAAVATGEEPAVPKPISNVIGGLEKLFPHMGHSRTPSACSAISFISSILSEPISENYPQSEPEMDSRGYEISTTAGGGGGGGGGAGRGKPSDLDPVGEGKEEVAESVTFETLHVDDRIKSVGKGADCGKVSDCTVIHSLISHSLTAIRINI